MYARAFWGEKNSGFDVLNQNLKAGIKNLSDFNEFLREINNLEENVGKVYTKLSKQMLVYETTGSFGPCWTKLGEVLERINSIRNKADTERQNLMKDVQRYVDELQKKQRFMKESETPTQEVVHSFQVKHILISQFRRLPLLNYRRLRISTTLVIWNTKNFVSLIHIQPKSKREQKQNWRKHRMSINIPSKNTIISASSLLIRWEVLAHILRYYRETVV